MSYPSYVGTPQLLTAGIGALSVSAPTGIQKDDLLMLFVESANQAVTTPSGYTIAPNSPQSTGTAGAAGGVRLSVFYKFTTGTESALTVADSGDHTAAIILAFRNVDKLNPFNTSAGGVLAAGNTAITLSAVTTTRSQCMIVNAVATDRDLNSTTTFSAWTNATTGNPTERFDEGTNSGTGGGIGVATALLGVAGASGSTTVTQATAVTAAFITYALAPVKKFIVVS